MKFTKFITSKPVSLDKITCFCILAVVLLAHVPQVVAQVVEKGLVSY